MFVRAGTKVDTKAKGPRLCCMAGERRFWKIECRITAEILLARPQLRKIPLLYASWFIKDYNFQGGLVLLFPVK